MATPHPESRRVHSKGGDVIDFNLLAHLLLPNPREKAREAPSELRPVEELAAGIIPFGKRVEQVGVCQPLTTPGFAQTLWDFGARSGVPGTGAHIGGGYLITARHVVETWRDPRLWTRKRGSSGHERFERYRVGWSIRYVPAPGRFTGGARAQLREGDGGRWNDWAMLHADELASLPALSLRRTSSVTPGEPVWAVGDFNGSSWRVVAGTFGGLEGVNAWANDCEAESGFSGSPLIDAKGRIVGVTSAMGVLGGRCYLVGTDIILDRLARARRFDPSLPRPV